MFNFQTAKYIVYSSLWIAMTILLIPSSNAQQSGTQSTSSDQTPKTPYQAEGKEEFSIALQPWKGDYDGMIQRKMIRILVPYSRTHYFLDGATERGIIAATGRELEQEINRREELRTRLVHVVFIPVPTKQLIPSLISGKGDIATGSLTITKNRKSAVAFTEPVFRNSKELVVTGPASPAISTIEDLSGKEVYVQPASSYTESLNKLNSTFITKGLPPMKIEAIDELLELDEILELVQAGLIPITVVDRHMAEFWSRVFPELTVHSELVVAAERDIAWAVRKDSPKLKEVLNEFLTPRRHRTTYGNIIFQRYMETVAWVHNPTASLDQLKFDQAIPFFRKYGEKYDLDPLFLAALGYQESRLDQGVVSPAGAIGVMQLLPATGAAMEVGDITQLEANIHAGARYLRYLIDTHINNPGIDGLNQTLLALASYNGGPSRIRRLRDETAEKGLDPNVWFHNVELAVAREIGRETVQYVRNIYKYYLTYQRVEKKRNQRAERETDG